MIDDHAYITSESDRAFQFLKDSENEHAALKAELGSLRDLRKTILAYEFIDAEGNIEQRKAISHASAEYVKHIEKIKDVEEQFQTLQNKRDRAATTLSMYQTVSANQRKGNI